MKWTEEAEAVKAKLESDGKQVTLEETDSKHWLELGCTHVVRVVGIEGEPNRLFYGTSIEDAQLCFVRCCEISAAASS